MADNEVLTWAGFGDAARELAAEIARDGFRPDLILGIARGGVVLAGALGYALDVKPLYLINVEYYTDVDERLPAPVILPPQLILDHLGDARVLLVDDVADTGHTLAMVRELCVGRVAELRTAVLYHKPQSTIEAEYVWRRTDRWIVFPWSAVPPVVATA